MKIVAALVLTLALALFPLSGIRAMPMSAVAAGHGHAASLEHGHDHAVAQSGHAHHHIEAAVHDHDHHDGPVEHAPAAATSGPSNCDWHDGLSSCCNMSCHAMAVLMPQAMPGLVTATTPLMVAFDPLPTGSTTDGLLRPPRRS